MRYDPVPQKQFRPSPASTDTPPANSQEWLFVWLGFAILIAGFWAIAQQLGVTRRIAGHLVSTILSFVLFLAPFWGFGFRMADVLNHRVRQPWIRRLLPGVLVMPYLVFALPRGLFSWTAAATLFFLPLALGGLLEWASRDDSLGAVLFRWQDAAALLLLGVPVEFHWLGSAFPIGGLALLPKLLLLDAGLYGFLVIRRVPHVGFELRLRGRDLRIGVQEWAFYAPIAIGLGLLTGFIHFHARLPAPGNAAAAVLVTFFFVSLPEEIFFRGLLQNLLSTRIARKHSLGVTAVLFGLSHFNKGMSFNMRYVILAALAGIFYGRAWMDRQRVPCSAITHTMVDVVWSLWFR